MRIKITRRKMYNQSEKEEEKIVWQIKIDI